MRKYSSPIATSKEALIGGLLTFRVVTGEGNGGEGK